MKTLILTAILFFTFISFGIARDPRYTAPKGVKPIDEWRCSKTHPIKTDMNLRTGAKIYHLPGDASYNNTKPQRCFATEKDAMAEGFRRAKR